jgi:hypothetical protein
MAGSPVLDHFKEALPFASDEAVALPLWEYAPEARKAVLSERRRRGLLQDPEDVTVDPLYH